MEISRSRVDVANELLLDEAGGFDDGDEEEEAAAPW
jgi:hypothetical protein